MARPGPEGHLCGGGSGARPPRALSSRGRELPTRSTGPSVLSVGRWGDRGSTRGGRGEVALPTPRELRPCRGGREEGRCLLPPGGPPISCFLWRLAHVQTHHRGRRQHKLNKDEQEQATVLTCLLNLPMRSDQRALRLEVKKQIIKYLDSDLFFFFFFLFFCPDLA